MAREKAIGVAAAGSLLATLVTGLACAGPLAAIVLGIGGFGWLARYAYLRVPATLATVALLTLGFVSLHRTKRRRARCSGEDASASPSVRVSRALLVVSAAIAVAVNVFEYVIFPRLG